MKDLEHVDCSNLKPMYNYKMSALKEVQDEVKEIYSDFKVGMNDPSRVAAKAERQWYIKQ